MKVHPVNITPEFITISQNGWKGFVLKDLNKVPIACLVNPNATDFGRSPFFKIHSSDFAGVYQYSINVSGKQHSLFLKTYSYRSWLDALKHLFRPSRAAKAFRAGLMLKENGIFTADTVAFLEKKMKFLHSQHILITREIINGKNLNFYSNDITLGYFLSLDHKRKMFNRLGKAIGQMHKLGIYHGDMRGGNILVVENNCSGWQFFFIDNERTKKYQFLPIRLRIKNLVQLNLLLGNITNSDRMRFFKAYALTNNFSPQVSKKIIRIVIKKTKNRLKKRSLTRIGFAGASTQQHLNYQRVQFPPKTGIFLKSFLKNDAAKRFLAQIEEIMNRGILIKSDRVTMVVHCKVDNQDVLITRYNYQGLLHSLLDKMRGSPAKKKWQSSQIDAEKSSLCNYPIGMIDEYYMGLIKQSYIINCFIED